jgi:hypothetical protein
MTYLVSPEFLRIKAHGIEGFNKIGATPIRMEVIAEQVATEWTEDWDEDQGFGSSDTTFMLQDFINRVIWSEQKFDQLKTDFTPHLSVVEK